MSDSKRHILLVEDDRLVAMSIARGLERAGFSVATTGSGQEAVRMCRERPPALVIMDIRLEDISGLDAARQIQGQDGIPIVFLSAFADSELVRDAIVQGGLGYLVKPIELNQILPMIESALARAEDMKRLRVQEQRLRKALAGDRSVSVAVGLIMERQGVLSSEAFELLRKRARAERRSVSEIAAALVAASDQLNAVRDRNGT